MFEEKLKFKNREKNIRLRKPFDSLKISPNSIFQTLKLRWKRNWNKRITKKYFFSFTKPHTHVETPYRFSQNLKNWSITRNTRRNSKIETDDASDWYQNHTKKIIFEMPESSLAMRTKKAHNKRVITSVQWTSDGTLITSSDDVKSW